MKWVILSLVLCSVYSLSTAATIAIQPKALSKFEKKIVEEIEKFKLQMKDGLPEANIPPMEPFDVPDQDLSPFKLGNVATLNVAKLTKTQVVGLSNFTIDHIKLNFMMMKVLINVTFSHVNIKGHYDIDGKAIGIIPIYGRGPFEANVHKTEVSSTAVLGTKDKKMQIESLDIYAQIEDLDLNMEGLLGGGSLGEQINIMLQKVASKMARNLVPQLAGKMSDFARTVMNEALSKMNVGGLIG